MPRLTKGQVAPGIAARAAAGAASAKARLSVLEKALSSSDELLPAEIDDVFSRFRSMEVCSGWSWPEKGISPLSIKTLRKYLVGNQIDFSLIRERVSNATGSSKKGIFRKDAADEKNASNIDKLLMMTAQYLDLLDRLSRVRHRIEEVEDILTAHFRLYDGPTRPKASVKVLK